MWVSNCSYVINKFNGINLLAVSRHISQGIVFWIRYWLDQGRSVPFWLHKTILGSWVKTMVCLWEFLTSHVMAFSPLLKVREGPGCGSNYLHSDLLGYGDPIKRSSWLLSGLTLKHHFGHDSATLFWLEHISFSVGLSTQCERTFTSTFHEHVHCVIPINCRVWEKERERERTRALVLGVLANHYFQHYYF